LTALEPLIVQPCRWDGRYQPVPTESESPSTYSVRAAERPGAAKTAVATPAAPIRTSANSAILRAPIAARVATAPAGAGPLWDAPDLQIRDQHRDHADRDDGPGSEEGRAADGGKLASEAHERHRAQDPGDQAAHVPAEGDVAAEAGAEGEVDHDQRHRLPGQRPGHLVLEHEQGTEDPEDGAGRADGDRVRREQERAGGSGQAGDDVEQEEAGPAERGLDGLAEPPESEHVQPQVDRPVVEESGREQAIPLAVREAERSAV